MYKREKAIQVVGSASMLIKNVGVLFNTQKGNVNFSVVHKGFVNVITATMDGSSHTQNQYMSKETSNNGTVIILQAKLLQMTNRVILVLCTVRGIQMYELEGAAMIFWHALEDSRDKSGPSCHARGICGVGGDTVFVGTYRGHVLMFNVPGKGTNVTQQDCLKGHKTSVVDLASGSGKDFVSGDDSGDIILWKSGQHYKPAVHIDGDGYPCSCVAMYKNVVIGGFGSGHIRLYSATNGQIAAEVSAHARWITGLDVANNGLLLSASDDTFVRVWQIKEGTPASIEHKHSEVISNLQLVGGCFTTPDGQGFCVAGYDSNELIFYRS